jgi:hypothetical protein
LEDEGTGDDRPVARGGQREVVHDRGVVGERVRHRAHLLPNPRHQAHEEDERGGDPHHLAHEVDDRVAAATFGDQTVELRPVACLPVRVVDPVRNAVEAG